MNEINVPLTLKSNEEARTIEIKCSDARAYHTVMQALYEAGKNLQEENGKSSNLEDYAYNRLKRFSFFVNFMIRDAGELRIFVQYTEDFKSPSSILSFLAGERLRDYAFNDWCKRFKSCKLVNVYTKEETDGFIASESNFEKTVKAFDTLPECVGTLEDQASYYSHKILNDFDFIVSIYPDYTTKVLRLDVKPTATVWTFPQIIECLLQLRKDNSVFNEWCKRFSSSTLTSSATGASVVGFIT